MASRRVESRSEADLIVLSQFTIAPGKADVVQSRGADLKPYWKEGSRSRWTRIQVMTLMIVVVLLHFLSLPFL